ncbi:aminotransferase class I/II-fold pyridoxal phosphate-dependent enzyme, partial [Burkholderia mallei]|uniref:aminotransferase class I/II-fold pyridoxal phosphate-dependent enzyme n=1 Tax=Burkholderia mallei TaxID=13373 RepID=UPI000AEFA721
ERRRSIAHGRRARGPAGRAGCSDTLGVRALREAIAGYMRKSRSVHCAPDQIIVTSGAQQGLYLACQVLLGAHDRAWVENPAYRGLTALLECTGRRDAMGRGPVDAGGSDGGAGRRARRDAARRVGTTRRPERVGTPESAGAEARG